MRRFFQIIGIKSILISWNRAIDHGEQKVIHNWLLSEKKMMKINLSSLEEQLGIFVLRIWPWWDLPAVEMNESMMMMSLLIGVSQAE